MNSSIRLKYKNKLIKKHNKNENNEEKETVKQYNI